MGFIGFSAFVHLVHGWRGEIVRGIKPEEQNLPEIPDSSQAPLKLSMSDHYCYFIGIGMLLFSSSMFLRCLVGVTLYVYFHVWEIGPQLDNKKEN